MKREPFKKPSKSRAEALIDEAVRQVESESEHEDDADLPLVHEIEEIDDLSVKPEDFLPVDDMKSRISDARRTSEIIAKIDVRQLVPKEAYMRVMADFENFRKRALKERQDSERNGREHVLRGFLDILDNMERGLSQAKGDEGALASGIRMVMSQVDTWLKSQGLEKIETVGVPFNPEFHEAISQIEVKDVAPGTIVEEVSRGYRWQDRLLRAARVVVSKGTTGSIKIS